MSIREWITAGVEHVTSVEQSCSCERVAILACVVLILVASLPATVVASEPPTAEFTVTPTAPTPDETVRFDASASSDADGKIVDYDWYLGGGSYPDGDGETFTTTFDVGGTYTVVLEVEDDAGNVDRYERTVTVENTPPEADIEYAPTNPSPDEPIRFTAASSTDTDGRIVDYDWYRGTGSHPDGDGENFEVSYDTAGTYRVTLVVEDNGERVDRVTETITVENEAPTATFDYEPATPTPDQRITFDASASGDADGEIVDYDWYVGTDDHPDGDEQTFSHDFDTAGVYRVRLVVTDNGEETASVMKNVNVTNNAPEPSFTTQSSPDGLGITFDASESRDTDGRIVDYDWYVGSGSHADGDEQTLTHEFDEKGSYEVRLVVTDNGDVSRTLTKTVGVSQRPTADIKYAGSAIPTNQTVTLSGSDSIDPDGNIIDYVWQLPDNRTVRGETVTTSVQAPGEYDVSLTVIDETNNSHTVTETLVAKQSPAVTLSWSPQTPRDDLDTTLRVNSSMPIESVTWDFDSDGSFDDATGQTVVHAFEETGKQSVQARVVAANGVATTVSDVVAVQQSAAFELTSVKTTVEEGESAVVTLSASNLVRETPMAVKLSLDLPDSGAAIASVDGASVASADETTFVTITPGQEKHVTVRIQFTEAGTYEIGGTAVYYFDESSSEGDDRRTATVEPISVTAEQTDADSDGTTRPAVSKDQGSKSSLPLFSPDFFGVGAGILLVIVLIYRRT